MAGTLRKVEGEGKVQTTNGKLPAAKAEVVCITQRSPVRVRAPLLF